MSPEVQLLFHRNSARSSSFAATIQCPRRRHPKPHCGLRTSHHSTSTMRSRSARIRSRSARMRTSKMAPTRPRSSVALRLVPSNVSCSAPTLCGIRAPQSASTLRRGKRCTRAWAAIAARSTPRPPFLRVSGKRAVTSGCAQRAHTPSRPRTSQLRRVRSYSALACG